MVKLPQKGKVIHMITENDVLKALIENKNQNNDVNPVTVCKALNITDVQLLEFVKVFETKGYINHKLSTLESLHLTPFAEIAYNEITIPQKAKKSFFNLTKFSFKTLMEILIGVAITVIAAFIIWWFGWQQP